MSVEKRKLRTLRRKVRDARADLSAAQSQRKRGELNIESLSSTQKRLRSSEWALNKFESDLLIEKARRKGIEIPRNGDWWDNDSEELSRYGMPSREIEESVSEWLTETGIFGAKNLFKLERRKTFEWWYTKVIIPALQALVPIIALFLVFFGKK